MILTGRALSSYEIPSASGKSGISAIELVCGRLIPLAKSPVLGVRWTPQEPTDRARLPQTQSSAARRHPLHAGTWLAGVRSREIAC